MLLGSLIQQINSVYTAGSGLLFLSFLYLPLDNEGRPRDTWKLYKGFSTKPE